MQTVVNFPTRFSPDYAIAFDTSPGNGYLYGLVNGGAGPLRKSGWPFTASPFCLPGD